MRYIKKSKELKELTLWKTKHHVVLNQMYSDTSITPNKLWEYLDNHQEVSVSKKILKQHLAKEQGYLCCYCGSRIIVDIHSGNTANTAIEHLQPKSNHRPLIYEYTNLLASCMGGSKAIIHKVAAGEDINSIGELYGVDFDYLETIYIDTDYPIHHFPDFEYLKVGDRLVIFKQLKKTGQHCDTHKDNDEIDITPLQSDCAKKFLYDKRTGAIKETKENKNTLAILGLNNNPYLLQNRLKNINEAIRKINALFEKITDIGQRKKILQQLIEQLKLPNKANQLRPWCFVEISILQGK